MMAAEGGVGGDIEHLQVVEYFLAQGLSPNEKNNAGKIQVNTSIYLSIYLFISDYLYFYQTLFVSIQL